MKSKIVGQKVVKNNYSWILKNKGFISPNTMQWVKR